MTAPMKMLMPFVAARVKEHCHHSGGGIDGGTSRPFAQGTIDARPCQVADLGRTSRRNRHDVVDMIRRSLADLSKPAIFASTTSPVNDEATQLCRDWAHGRLPFDLHSARRRNMLMICAISTNPSASFRSGADSLPSMSCLSNNCCKRRSSAFGKRSCFRSPGKLTRMVVCWAIFALQFEPCNPNHRHHHNRIAKDLPRSWLV